MPIHSWKRQRHCLPIIYVDDLLICGKDGKKIQKIKKLLSDRFKMKDLGEINEYLGINVNYDYIDGKMKLSQEIVHCATREEN